jgi:hypothetical protein
MRRALSLSIPLLAVALAAGCTPRAVIPDTERDRVRRELAGEQRWLRVAAYAAPLYGDTSKVMLSDQPLDELDLVETAGGAPVPPPKAERIVPPGTAVRITDVEFPSGWIIAKRVVMTPRYHPWVLVEVPSEKRPYVVVLSQTAATYDDVRGELDRILTKDDPSSALAALPEEQRAAVLKKTLVEGMAPRAVELAWGVPERVQVDRPAQTETWSWPGGKRTAFFQEDRLVRWQRAE